MENEELKSDGLRKVVLYIAQSLDGYIARSDGDISWLSVAEWPGEDYGYYDFFNSVDTVVVGRKAYDKVMSFGMEFPYKSKKCYVVSKSAESLESIENVEFISDADMLLKRLKSEEGMDVFVDGGGELASYLISKGYIDRIILTILPITIGSGLRLFREHSTQTYFKLVRSKAYESGAVQIEYERDISVPLK